MSKVHSECPDSDPPDGPLDADIFLRQEPEEEEEEEEGDDGKEKDDDDKDEGYSE